MTKRPDNSKLPEKPEPFGKWFKPFQELLNEPPVKGLLENIDEFFRQPLFPKSSFQVDVQDRGDKHLVTAALPGVRKEQIGIDIIGDTLTISVKKQDILTEEDDKNKVYRRSESLQRSIRTLSFPHPIEERKVKASYRDGLLEISIPKVKGKTIEIHE
ncbi:Molecular chaperone IbpA, HSP20 family [Mesobacillus persicus]|uniref:Molecular chaperone IbpA, HSP20 family n=1 Tax=Mesobacillus persicus TaxID=930146 RepID=A0A1H8A8Q0_9BACI|nr:Hsp20/alpha crystallin family protein [Mesobacillus persicus]SEM66208.1 Molecular chaperone IbpA, HSP20 family [Mesobacillus persicus]